MYGQIWVIGILLVVALYTDVVKTLNRTEEDPVGLVISNADTLPLVHRSAIANALSARGHDTAFLGRLEKPNVASFVEGTNAPEYKYHWFVQILYIERDSIFRCAGTVYNEKTIITSAYCAGDTEQARGYYMIIAGDYDREVNEGPEQIVMVDDIRQHPEFRWSGAFVYRNDIALMITDEPLNFTAAVKPVPRLSTRRKDKMALRSKNCVAIGYGELAQASDVAVPDILQEFSPVNFAPHRICHNAAWKNNEYSLTPRMICSLDGHRAGDCYGDLGGPAGCYDNNGVFYLVGLTAWGPAQKNAMCNEYPNMYTRVSKYLRWIKYFSYRV